MGTLYECLKEARLEKYYEAFRANGITRSESLANLTMPEFCAMGISGADDRRRLMELVNIIKSVHRSQIGTGGSSARRRQQGSPTSAGGSARQAPGSGSGYISSQPDRRMPWRIPHSASEGVMLGGSASGFGGSGFHHHPSGLRLEPTRDVSVRERGPNFSAASYLEMLELVSDSSGSSDAGDHLGHSQDSDDAGSQSGGRTNVQAPALPFSVKASKKVSALDRVKLQTVGSVSGSKSKGYNYGVPSSRDLSSPSVKSRTRASGKGITKDDRIRVCVRKRPLSRRESRASDPDIIEAQSTSTVVVKEPKVAVDLTAFIMKHEFVYDEVFDEDSTNEDVYIRAARPLISTVFQGGNATFFAYGQTGAGKTHTMLGGNGIPGLYQLAAQDVYDIIASGRCGMDLHVWVSFFEIYCGQLFDLLNKRNRLVPREDGSHRVCIAGLTETEAPDVDTLIKVLQYGNSVRSRGTSGVNPDSSRSHAVLQLEIRHADEIKLGKVSFIDLAGSERASDMGDPDKQTRMEGAEINQSLLALKECIRSIDQESRHTPFRQSKLTHILKDAFVGNSRTCMIANVSPCQSSCEHTLNTLRYADRVKELRRDSSPNGREGGSGSGSSALGQAVNLLMNIPITAPSIFHPSKVLSTSTPVRPRLVNSNTSAAADAIFDPSETPIRGHHMISKSALVPKLVSTKTGAIGKQGIRSSSSSKRQDTAAAAAQGMYQPHPEASPSESDQTDTDSNNVTHPTEVRPAPSVANIPVIGSTDTEFDFPTSDFNNIDDQLNDLSHLQRRNDLNGVSKSARPEEKRGVSSRGQAAVSEASAASSGGARSKSQTSHQKGKDRAASPKVNQLLRKTSMQSPVPDRHTLSPSHRQIKNDEPRTERLPSPATTAAVLKPQLPPTRVILSEPYQNVTGKEAVRHLSLVATSDTFDDELLFAAGDTESVQQLPQPPVLMEPHSRGAKEKKHFTSAVPAVQSAISIDLTSIAHRSPLRNGSEKAATDHLDRGNTLHLTEAAAKAFHGGDCSENGRSQFETRKARLPFFSTAPTKEPLLQALESVALGNYANRTEDRDSSSSSKAPSDVLITAHTLPGCDTLSARDVLMSTSPFIVLEGKETEPSATRPEQLSHWGSSGPSSDPSAHTSAPESRHSQLHQSSSLPSTLFAKYADQQHEGAQEGLSARSTSSDSTLRGVCTPSSGSSQALAFTTAPISARAITFASAAVVTEKLMSGAVFSPIHPQPASTSGSRPPVASPAHSSSYNILHPMPVPAVPSAAPSAPALFAYASSTTERNQARMSLVSSHEDQLAAVTSLCKLEMKLLLNAKKSATKSFDDYISRVNNILTQKMAAIQQLQEQIQDYRVHFSSLSASQMTTSSNTAPRNSFSSQTH